MNPMNRTIKVINTINGEHPVLTQVIFISSILYIEEHEYNSHDGVHYQCDVGIKRTQYDISLPCSTEELADAILDSDSHIIITEKFELDEISDLNYVGYSISNEE